MRELGINGLPGLATAELPAVKKLKTAIRDELTTHRSSIKAIVCSSVVSLIVG